LLNPRARPLGWGQGAGSTRSHTRSPPPISPLGLGRCNRCSLRVRQTPKSSVPVPPSPLPLISLAPVTRHHLQQGETVAPSLSRFDSLHAPVEDAADTQGHVVGLLSRFSSAPISLGAVPPLAVLPPSRVAAQPAQARGSNAWLTLFAPEPFWRLEWCVCLGVCVCVCVLEALRGVRVCSCVSGEIPSCMPAACMCVSMVYFSGRLQRDHPPSTDSLEVYVSDWAQCEPAPNRRAPPTSVTP
jgi:hypothetical protein